MKTLGFSCYYHDAAAALVEDGVVVSAVEEERLTRKKHDNGFPENSLHFCVDAAGGIENIDTVVFYEKPLAKFYRNIRTAKYFPPNSWDAFTNKMVRLRNESMVVERRFREAFCFKGDFLYSEHHFSHGASSFFCSPFDNAAVVTLDGVGELATATIGVGRGCEYKLISELHYPVSLGLFYSAFTAFLGFKVNSDEYKVMGLASYGKPVYSRELDKIINVLPDGTIRMDMDYFSYHVNDQIMYSKKFEEHLGPPSTPESTPGRREMDIAASVQAKLEEIVSVILLKAHRVTGEKNLCLAGGVALNGVANWKCFLESPFDGIYIQPAAGDSGGAVGAALLGYFSKENNKARVHTDFNPYLGPMYDDDTIEKALESLNIRYRRLDDETLFKETAQAVMDDLIVGWFQGRMEFGPRALGNRSILANPTNPDMKNIINSCIKFREPFRPFAPAVIQERAWEFFDLRGCVSPYMLLVPQALDGAADRIPSVVHVDNSARVQTVSQQMNPKFYRLLETFEAISGVPVLLNTSFNVRGEPIVCTPLEAARCFLNTEMDVLILNNYITEKAF